MNSLVENQIKQYISERPIKNREVLSEAFNMRCEKITLDNNKIFVLKYYQKKVTGFNSITSEINSLTYLSDILPSIFPAVKYKSKNLMIIDFIEHNNIKESDYQIVLAKEILKLHTIKNDKFGFDFDAQIGGLKQPNNYKISWIDFF